MLEYAVLEETGPVAVRYPRGGEGKYTAGGREPTKIIRQGTDVTVVTYGVNINDALEAADLLEKDSIHAEIIKLGRIKPIDYTDIIASVRKTGRLAVVEECAEAGCAGMRIAAELCQREIPLKWLSLKNLGDGVITGGKVTMLKRLKGIDAESVAAAIIKEFSDE